MWKKSSSDPETKESKAGKRREKELLQDQIREEPNIQSVENIDEPLQSRQLNNRPHSRVDEAKVISTRNNVEEPPRESEQDEKRMQYFEKRLDSKMMSLLGISWMTNVMPPQNQWSYPFEKFMRDKGNIVHEEVEQLKTDILKSGKYKNMTERY